MLMIYLPPFHPLRRPTHVVQRRAPSMLISSIFSVDPYLKCVLGVPC